MIDSNLRQKSGNVLKRESARELVMMPVTFYSSTREGKTALVGGCERTKILGPVKSAKKK